MKFKIYNIANNFIKIGLFIVYVLTTGCISISEKKTDYKNAIVAPKQFDNLITTYFVSPDRKVCAAKYQKIFIQNAVKKYFSAAKNAKVNVVVTEKFYPGGVAYFTMVLAIVTYSIVPVYSSASYEIVINIQTEESNLFYRSFINDEMLISIFAIPFMPDREVESVRKNNIENAIYISSISTANSNSSLFKIPTEPTRDCENSLEDTFGNHQRW